MADRRHASSRDIPFIRRGTAEFRRTNLAFLCAGFATFALLYCVQPLLPAFAAAFGVSPATSSLSLSLPTAVMACCLLVAGALSETLGRKPMMVASVLFSAVLTLGCSLAPGWEALLTLRVLLGIALSGLPAIAMAYITEEMEPSASGFAMGLYISGTAAGGMAGRVITGLLLDWGSWHWAMGAIGLLGLAAAVTFWWALPPSRHFEPRPLALGGLLANYTLHLRDAGLRWLFLEGFLFMGSFVTLYNYIGFRLIAPPFDLGQSAVALVFTLYIVGIGASTLVGWLADRYGRRTMLWSMALLMLAGLGLTLPPSLPLTVGGIAAMTFGFFGAHSLASSWVGRRAQSARAQASSLYLFAYYMGASIMGVAGGWVWARAGWTGIGWMLGGTLTLALLVAVLRLARLRPAGRG
ncbi:MFS transporter [Teichococcus vastitatis]|uniref:MFS transporter n=1 Tax=Teichococcus vastitatis TaxID=2307076 RepID=A0ABS9W4G7_9PROT|nr:MFS transporter [Pseudoroseomonas vastitatis]MCI0754076.1 MFS transporter [Pseudoroseomonas vastitatis]